MDASKRWCDGIPQRADEAGLSPTDEQDGVLARLSEALRDAGVPFVHSRHEAVYTSVEAADVRGSTLHSGAKALILKAGEQFVMAVLPADCSLDGTTLRKNLGCRRLRFATAEEVLRLTGLAPGSIPPFGSLFRLSTVCDEALSDNTEINFNAGSHTDSFRMAYSQYIGFESPQIMKFAKS